MYPPQKNVPSIRKGNWWIEEIQRRHSRIPRAPHIVLIGNKSDLKDYNTKNKSISIEKSAEKEENEKEGKLEIFDGGEVSAKTGYRVFESIQHSVERYVQSGSKCPLCKI